jgi:type IV pilus assembly protein PilB
MADRATHDPRMTTRLRLGDLLVSSKILSPSQLEDALAHQKTTGLRLGETLVALGLVTELQVAQVLSHQLSIPWVDLVRVDFSRELLNLVSPDLAEAARVVPIYVRKMRQGEVLFVATDDPLNEAGLAEVAAHAGLPVRPMVASARDLRDALRAYYGREIPAPARLAAAAPTQDLEVEIELPTDEPAAPSPTGPEPASAGPAASSEPAAGDEPAPTAQPAVEPQAVPQRRNKRAPSRPKMLTLTLLDGTTIKLPQPSTAHDEPTPAAHQLTSRDLIQALLLRAEGKDVSSVLRDAHWETLFASLLSLLLEKGLVTDWEFVEAWTKTLRGKANAR